jgi:solute carrier family 27 fatty acid transporter 1/4
VPNVEGRAGMVAIVDTDNTLDLAAFVKGAQATLPSYACPLFVRVLSQLEMTGKNLSCV